MIQDSSSKTVPFSRRFKNKLFYLFHNLLLFKDIGPNLGAALLLLQCIQSLILTFNGKNPYLGAYFFGYIISDIDVIQLYPVVDRYFAASARIATNLFLLAFVFGIFISLIVLANKKDYVQNVGIQHIAYLLGYFYEFTTKLLFVPIFGTFIITIKCGDKDVVCLAGSHIILLVSSVAGIILLLIVAYTIDAFFFDFSFKTKDSLAHAPVSDFVLGFIYKTVAVILTVGVFDLEYSSLVALYHIVFNSFFLFNSIKKVTYFDLKVHVMNLIASATLMWTNASLVAVDLVDFQLLRNNTIFIIIAGSAFFVMLCRNVRQKTQDNLVTKEAGELESDILLDSKVRFFFKLARSSRNDSQADLLFASLIKIHIDHCTDIKCPCKNRESLYDPKRNTFGESKSNPHQDQTFIKHFIYYMLKSGSIKFFNSELVFLDTIFFLFEAMRNYPQAYHLIHVYEKKNMSNNLRIVMQFIIYRLYAKMQDYSQNRNSRIITSVLPYEKVMEFDDELKTLKSMIQSQIEHYMNVWEMINSDFPDLNILNKLLEKTFNYKEKVINQYEKTVKINDQSYDLKILMAIYASQIAYDDELALKVDREIKPRVAMDNHSDNFNFDRDMVTWNIFDPNCYTIEIANQMDKLGKIINFSKNTTELLGYNAQDLKFQNVRMLIPRTVAFQHDQILEDFFINGQDSGLRHAIHNFSLNSRGYCFSCHIILKAIPMHGYYRLMALFRMLNQSDYLITNDKGTIDAFGKKVGEMLELTPQTIQTMRLNFALIAPKIIKYYHYYLIKKEKSLVENSVTKIRSFYIFIPTNWKSFLQKWQEKRRPKSMVSVPSLNLGSQEPEDFEDMDEYYNNMLEFMMRDKQPSWKKIFKVKAIVEHMEMRNKKIQMKSFKIISYKEKNIQEVPQEKIKKQQAFIPILAKKISKILDQRKRIAHQIEIDKHKAEEIEKAEEAAEEEAEKGKEGHKKEGKEIKKPKGIWGNVLEKAKKRGSRKSEKSLDLIHADSDHSERALNDGRDDESLDGMSSDHNTPRGDSKTSSQIGRVDTEKTIVKKPSILKKKSMKDQDQSFDRQNSVIERFKKKVKIFQEKKRIKEPTEEAEGSDSPISAKKEKKKKVEKPLAFVSLVTEESSSYDDFDVAEKGDFESVDSKKLKEKGTPKAKTDNKKGKKDKKDPKEKKEEQDMIERKHIGPSSVASSSSYQVKDFTVRLKALLKAKYVPASLRMSNGMEILLTLLVLLLTNILSIAIRSQVGDWVDSIQTINTPNLYEVYLYKTMDSYLTLDLLAGGVLNSTIYDNTWFEMDKAERETMYNDIRLLRKNQLESAAFSKDLYSFYFGSESYRIITKGVQEVRNGNFSEFLGRFMNALQMTQNYGLSQFNNSRQDEFLYILNYNFYATLGFLTQQKASISETIADALSTIQSLVTGEQISCTVIIVFSLAIILPMFLMHNLHLEEILVLFTNVSKRDSDFYHNHYRDMKENWSKNADDPKEFQKVVEIVEEQEAREKKASKLSTNSKSRLFKRLKRNYKKFIVIISSSILVCVALSTVKAVIARSELSDIQEYLDNFKSLSEEGSNVFKILHNYKVILTTVAKGGMPTQQQLADYATQLQELEQYSETTLSVDDQQSIGLSQTNIDYLKWISVNNTCIYVGSDVQKECESLFGGTLKKGFLVVRSPLHSFANDYFKRFIQVMNTGTSADLINKSKVFLNDQDLKDYLRAWTFVQKVIFEWLDTSYADMQVKEDGMMSGFNLLLGLTCFSLVMNLLTWRYSYRQLVQTLLKFHRYFEILPLELIQNNRSMRFYFERYFRLKERR